MQQFFDNIIKMGFERLKYDEKGIAVFQMKKGRAFNAFCFVDTDVINAPSTERLLNIWANVMYALLEVNNDNTKLIMVVMSHDINNARKYAMDLADYWLLNTETKRLIIYDGQTQELVGMRYMLEHYLETGEMAKPQRQSTQRIAAGRNMVMKQARGLSDYLTMSNIIIIANVIVYIIVMIGGDVNDAAYIETKGGLTVDGIKDGEYYRMFTSLFLHYGATHLIYNMLFIFAFGNSIEQFLGRIRLAIIYFGGGIGGSIFAYLYNAEHNQYAVTAGASGAAYALFGGLIALAILDSRTRYDNPIALIVIAVLFISEGFTGDSNVANAAHIGGIVIGLLIALIVIFAGNKISEIKRSNKNKRE